MTDGDAATDAPEPEPTRADDGGWHGRGRAFLELFALSGIAFAQPMLDLLSKSTGLFFTRNTTGFQTILLVLLILLVPPTVLWLVETAIGALVPSVRNWLHAAFAGLLVAVITVESVKKATSLGPTALLIAGALIGVAGGFLVLRFDGVRQFLRILAIAPVVFGLLFLVASPVSDVVFASQTKAVNVGFRNPKRVVFILFDEFPEMSLLNGSGQVDPQLFPNFAAFADTATWYRNETTLAPYTDRAVPAILTGADPHGPSAQPDASDYPDNLFTLLGKAYGMNVHEPVTRLCPQNICKSASGSGFTSLIRQSVDLWKSFASPHRTKASFNFNDAAEGSLGTGLHVGQEFIDSIQPATTPQLDYAHIEMPHQPWQLLPDQRVYKTPDYLNVTWPDPGTALIARERHLLQVQATDTMLGQIIAKVKSVGAYDDSLIVVTADHGVAFTSGQPNRAVTEQNFSQIMWPPLLVKYPNETTGKTDDRPAQSVDILPTIADTLGVKIPWHVDGTSLRGPVKPDFPRRMYQNNLPGFTPDIAPTPAPGHDFLTFDAGVGFPQVLKGRAAPAGAKPDLRVYAQDAYGGLIGKQAAPLVTGSERAMAIGVRKLGQWNAINPSAPRLPWFYNEGFIGPLTHSASVAIALDGKIVAVAPTIPFGADSKLVEFLVPPELVHSGKNTMSVYVVSGTPDAPKLRQVSVTNSAF